MDLDVWAAVTRDVLSAVTRGELPGVVRDVLPGVARDVPVTEASLRDLPHEGFGGRAGEGEVEEAGPADVHPGDLRLGGQPR
ncbi:hypothetical protein [Streptomyces alfalfae]